MAGAVAADPQGDWGLVRRRSGAQGSAPAIGSGRFRHTSAFVALVGWCRGIQGESRTKANPGIHAGSGIQVRCGEGCAALPLRVEGWIGGREQRFPLRLDRSGLFKQDPCGAGGLDLEDRRPDQGFERGATGGECPRGGHLGRARWRLLSR